VVAENLGHNTHTIHKLLSKRRFEGLRFLNGIQEARGSTPLGSTKKKHLHEAVFGRCFLFVEGDPNGICSQSVANRF
jgi:hypothetical protein